jgi:hypothetical protein
LPGAIADRATSGGLDAPAAGEKREDGEEQQGGREFGDGGGFGEEDAGDAAAAEGELLADGVGGGGAGVVEDGVAGEADRAVGGRGALEVRRRVEVGSTTRVPALARL